RTLAGLVRPAGADRLTPYRLSQSPTKPRLNTHRDACRNRPRVLLSGAAGPASACLAASAGASLSQLLSRPRVITHLPAWAKRARVLALGSSVPVIVVALATSVG